MIQIDNGWMPITEYSRDKYDWVLIKYFDGIYECVPDVAEMRSDGKWYNSSDRVIPFEVKYFFDIQQLDDINTLKMETVSIYVDGELLYKNNLYRRTDSNG